MPYSAAEASASINPVLSDVANHFDSSIYTWFQDFVAPDIINNGALSGQIPIHDTEKLRKEVNSIHTPGQKPTKIDMGGKTYQSYDLVPHSLMTVQYGDEDKRIAQAGMDPEVDLMSRIDGLAMKLMIEEHVALYTLLGTSGNYDSSVVTAAGTAWTADAADPINNVKTNVIAQEDFFGFRPRFGIINSKTFDSLRHHVNITSRLSSDKDKVASIDEIAMLFGLEKVLVTDAKRDSSKPDGTVSIAPIWGNTMVLFNRPDTVSMASLRSGAPVFAATIRNEARNLSVMTSENMKDLDPGNNGYYYEHVVKAGYYAPKFISVNDSSNLEPIAGGIITGLY
jgi:hypothetical protein